MPLLGPALDLGSWLSVGVLRSLGPSGLLTRQGLLRFRRNGGPLPAPTGAPVSGAEGSPSLPATADLKTEPRSVAVSFRWGGNRGVVSVLLLRNTCREETRPTLPQTAASTRLHRSPSFRCCWRGGRSPSSGRPFFLCSLGEVGRAAVDRRNRRASVAAAERVPTRSRARFRGVVTTGSGLSGRFGRPNRDPRRASSVNNKNGGRWRTTTTTTTTIQWRPSLAIDVSALLLVDSF